MLKEKKVIIYSPGDPSVGIWSAKWTISGDEMIFENEQDREEFREAVLQAFGLLADDHTVIFGSEDLPEIPLDWFDDPFWEDGEPFDYETD